MEPLMSLEGYRILENTDRARELLNQFYEEQGFTVVKPKQKYPIPQTSDRPEQDNKSSAR